MKRKSTLRSLRCELFLWILVFSALLSANESRVFFSGNEAISDNKIDAIFGSEGVGGGAEKILEIYLDEGYPFAKIILDSSHVKGDASFYFFTIVEGGRCRVSGVKNSSFVKSSFLEGVLGLKGKIFSASLIEESFRRLGSYSFISNDFNYTVKRESDTLIFILTKINQKKSSTVSGTLSSDFESSFLTGFLDLSIVSPFGYGDSYTINYSRASRENTDLEAGFDFPFIFSSPFGVFFKGEFISVDSTLSDGSLTTGFLFILNSFRVKTGFGKTFLFRYDYPDSGQEYSHVYGEISYVKSPDKTVSVKMKNDLVSSFSTALEAGFLWGFAFGKTILENYSDVYFSLAKNYEISMGKHLGGNSNLKSYAEDFVFASDYIFLEERFFYSGLGLFKPGVFADGAVFRKDKNEPLKSFLYSYGAVMNVISGNLSFNLYYAMNPDLSPFEGRIHLSLSYGF